MSSILLAQINVFPVKSLKGIAMSTAMAEKPGLAFDRRFMLVLADGSMVTARKYPQMVLVTCSLLPHGIMFSHQDMAPLVIHYAEFKLVPVQATVWKDCFDAYTTTDAASQWFSQIIGEAVELLYLGQRSNRYREKVGNPVSFVDGYPLLLISQASLDELNRRSHEPHSMAQFRTNLVVSGTQPFDEDSWKVIRIGQAEFEVVKPCERCILTTVNPKTGRFHENKEPLRTLALFRANSSGGVFFGQNLLVRKAGMIQQGDVVEVLEYQAQEEYEDRQQPSCHQLVCVGREPVARDFETFWFEPQSGTLPDYLPGQYIPIEVDIDGEKVVRYYTLSSSPSRLGRLAISVKRMNGGRVSNWLIDHLNLGDRVKIESPNGQFHLDIQQQHSLLLLSAGSGITPMLSMLRYLVDHHTTQNVVFYHQARTEADIPYREELDELARISPQLTVLFSLTQPETQWSGLKGRFSLSHLKMIPDILERHVFVCGPEGFMEKAKHLLHKTGLDPAQYHQEYFGIQQANISAPRKTVLLTFNDRVVKGNNRATLLEQADNHGVDIANSCRAGVCGACKVRIESGEVSQPDMPALSDEEKAQGKVLACCCVPKTDTKIRY